MLRELKIEVTHKCPLACIHCSSDSTSNNNLEMTLNNCIDILEQAKQIGVRKIAFSGGEPLIWKYIEEVIEAAAIFTPDITVYSSGNIQSIDSKLSGLKKFGLNKVVFSIFGAESKSHESITRKSGSFVQTIKAIEVAKNMRLSTELHFVPLESNYMMLDKIAELGRELGIEKISVLRFVPQGRGHLIAKRALNRLQNVQLKRKILALRGKGYDIRTGSPYNFLMLNHQPKCCSAIDRLIIGPDLHIYPCDAFKQIEAKEIIGTSELSTIQGTTLQECWEKAPYLQAIRDYLITDFNEPCKSCNELEMCLSGCLAQKVITYGNLCKGIDPMCLKETNK